MRWILAAMLSGLFAGTAWADPAQPRYEVRPGNLSGLPSTAPDPTPSVTILIDHQTGRSWLLAVIDGEVRWQAMPFDRSDATDTLPPVPKADPSDDEPLRDEGRTYKP